MAIPTNLIQSAVKNDPTSEEERKRLAANKAAQKVLKQNRTEVIKNFNNLDKRPSYKEIPQMVEDYSAVKAFGDTDFSEKPTPTGITGFTPTTDKDTQGEIRQRFSSADEANTEARRLAGFSDITRPPKIDETNPALPLQGPQEQPRQVTAEGSLKADQLMATASEPVALGGVVDDVVNAGKAGKFQASPQATPQATPKADAYMAKREAPKFDASKVMTKDAQGNYVPEEDPSKLRAAEMGFNRNALAMEREDRTSRRKDFASQLNAANYNPATASSEDKAKFYAMGKDMGLSSDQIDSYANKQLDKQAERDYKRANMGKFLETADSRRGRSSGVQGSRGLRRQSNSNIRTSQADLDKQDRRNQYFG